MGAARRLFDFGFMVERRGNYHPGLSARVTTVGRSPTEDTRLASAGFEPVGFGEARREATIPGSPPDFDMASFS
jgi:hypothetical protein